MLPKWKDDLYYWGGILLILVPLLAIFYLRESLFSSLAFVVPITLISSILIVVGILMLRLRLEAEQPKASFSIVRVLKYVLIVGVASILLVVLIFFSL
jgi:hypothetical protein